MAFWSSAWRKRRRYAELSPQERWLLLHAAVLLPLVAVVRRVTSFKRLQALAACLMPLEQNGDYSKRGRLDIARRCARSVQIAANNGMFRPNCLERSLVLWGLLRRQGIDGRIVIGARKVKGQFEAHAWVEVQGTVLNDFADVGERFAVLTVEQNSSEKHVV